MGLCAGCVLFFLASSPPVIGLVQMHQGYFLPMGVWRLIVLSSSYCLQSARCGIESTARIVQTGAWRCIGQSEGHDKR